MLWNLAASKRIELYGRDGVVKGDLVFPKDSAVDLDDALMEPQIEIAAADEAAVGVHGCGGGEEGVENTDAKRAKTTRAPLPSVHVVTKEDMEKGTFELTDVVLPMPG